MASLNNNLSGSAAAGRVQPAERDDDVGRIDLQLEVVDAKAEV